MHKCDEQKKCVNDALAKAELVCQERGLRFTEIRKFILRLIWDNPKPSKAYDLLGEVSKMNYSAKPPTVYRALDFLLENGFIHKINTLNAYIACTHTLKHDHCYFIICDKCDQVQECCDEAITETIEKTLSQNRFSHKEIALEISGSCDDCLKN